MILNWVCMPYAIGFLFCFHFHSFSASSAYFWFHSNMTQSIKSAPQNSRNRCIITALHLQPTWAVPQFNHLTAVNKIKSYQIESFPALIEWVFFFFGESPVTTWQQVLWYCEYLNNLAVGVNNGFLHLLHVVNDLVKLHQFCRQLLNLQMTSAWI